MSKILNAIIVDDERLARKELILMLNEFANINVIGEAADIKTAQKLLSENSVDLVFLDIQMPGESGFDLINSIPIKTKVIFVTAFDEYAIRAFDVNALDYLLKPVNPKRLKETIERIEELSKNDSTAENSKKLLESDRLLVTLNSKLQFIKIKNIIYISAAGDYTEIQTSDNQKGITLKSIKEWEARLPETLFARIHRSTIVNLEFIERIEEWFQKSYRIHLKSVKEPFDVSRRYTSKLKERFS